MTRPRYPEGETGSAFDQRRYWVPVTLYIRFTGAVMGYDVISVVRIARVNLRWVTVEHKTALSCSADPLLRPGHAHRGACAVGEPSQLTATPPPLLHPSPIPTFHFSGNGNIPVLTHAQTHSHSSCAVARISGLSKQIPPSVGDAVISLGSELSWMLSETTVGGFFPTFLGNDQRWASGAGRRGGEVNKEESIG